MKALLGTNKLDGFIKLARFGIVGVLNTLVDILSFVAIIFFFGLTGGIGFVLAKMAAFIIANINSFIWNKLWVFDESKTSANESGAKQFTSFFAVSVLGLLINAIAFAAISYLLTLLISLDPVVLGVISVILAALVSMAWNFVGYKCFVFEKK